VIAGVRCQPSRSKKATRDDLIYVGNAGWRTNDAVAPSFLVKVRVGQSQRDAVEQHEHPKLKEAADRAGAEAGAGAAGCKLSESAGGEAGKAGREAGGADDAMDCFEGDEAGGEADGKAAADLSGADRCGAGTASGCEADGEARGAGGGELGEAGREVGGANDGTGGDETGGEANRMVADLRREADGSEDCGAHCGEDTELGHVRRELFAELGEVGASAAAAASTAAAAAASAASLQLQPRHRRGPSALGRASSASIQSRLSEVAVVVGPCTPNFRRLRRGRSRPRRPLLRTYQKRGKKVKNIDFQYLQIATIYLQILPISRISRYFCQTTFNIFAILINILQYIDQYIGQYFRDIGKY